MRLARPDLALRGTSITIQFSHHKLIIWEWGWLFWEWGNFSVQVAQDLHLPPIAVVCAGVHPKHQHKHGSVNGRIWTPGGWYFSYPLSLTQQANVDIWKLLWNPCAGHWHTVPLEKVQSEFRNWLVGKLSLEAWDKLFITLFLIS